MCFESPERTGADQSLALWEPHINAFVTLCAETAPVDGPLSTIRLGVKDIIDVAGVPTRNGSEACRDAPVAQKDAAVVARLRGAGARIVGKTVTTEFAFTDPTSCRNPHDLRRSPGGSSSGSGAAVAAGVVDAALGTQTAGSLCRPAAYCGVVGFKPGYGVLPTTGVTPLAPSFDTIGIIAGTVALTQKVFSVFDAGAAAPDRAQTSVAVGMWQTDVAPDPDTQNAQQGAARALAALGAHVTQRPLSADVAAIVTAHRKIMQFEAFCAHGSMLDDARGGLLKPKFLAGLRAGAGVSAAQAAAAKAALTQAAQAFWAGLEDVDMILTLPVPEGAPLIGATTGFQDWLTPWTVLRGPLICLPWGLDGLGRPRSVMLAARPGRDAALLAMAAQLEQASPGVPAPRLP